MPSANRSQFSLMQTIPGLVPTLQIGSFEGGQFSANGQATNNNLFLVDGQYDNDSRRGGSQGTQARISLDSMAEYQVQTHTYSAEYGGATGVVVNSVTRSGTNTARGPRLRVLPGRQAHGDRLLPETGGPGEPGIRAATCSAAASAARSSGTRRSSSSTARRRARMRRRTSTSRPMRRRWRRRTRRPPISRGRTRSCGSTITRPTTTSSVSAGRAKQVLTENDSIENDKSHPGQCPARERRGRPGVQRLLDVGPERPGHQRAQVRPRAGEPAAGLAVDVRRRLEVHRVQRHRAVRRRRDEHASGLRRRPAEQLRSRT